MIITLYRIVTIPTRKSSRLEVSNAIIESNGVYQCIVSNDAGSVMHSFTVEVIQGQSPGIRFMITWHGLCLHTCAHTHTHTHTQ